MAEYDVEIPGQGKFHISAASDQEAQAAMDHMMGKSDIGQVESFARGAGNNFPLAPQAIAGGEAMFGHGNYSDNLADWNSKAQAAKAAHPITYGAGAVAGSLAPLAIPGVGEALEAAPVLGNAALGAANAVSNIDLSKNPGEALKEGAIGAVTGGALGKASEYLRPVADTAGQYAERMASNEGIKALGARSGQIGKLGVEESREAAQEAMRQGLLDPTVGAIGMEQKAGDIVKGAEGTIGAVRKSAGAAPTKEGMSKLIMDQYGPKYMTPGLNSSEGSSLQAVLAEIKKLPDVPTFQDWANLSTKINDHASSLTSMQQPAGAFTDAANAISYVNNAHLQQAVPADLFQKYEMANKTYSQMRPIEEFMKKGEIKDMSSRGGPSIGEDVKHMVYNNQARKAVATGLNKLAPQMHKAPQVVAQELDDYLTSRYGAPNGGQNGNQ